MGLIRKSLFLGTGGLVAPNSKKQRQQKQMLAAMQGATPSEVRRAGGRYDFDGFWGQPPPSVARKQAQRQPRPAGRQEPPRSPEGQASSEAALIPKPPSERLAEVTSLHDAGLLTDEEYQAKRAEIINEL
jgi:hypothetical protein